MANPIALNTPLSNQIFLEPIPSTRFAELISKIQAEQIEMIGLRIANNIAGHIGCVAKARITHILVQRKGKNTFIDRVLVTMQDADAQRAVKEGKSKVFSEQEKEMFMKKILCPIKKAISGAFSTPLHFMMEGIKFTLSEDGPCGILADAAIEIGVPMSSRDVPQHYTLELKWNEVQSLQQQTLVFSLIEKGNGIEFFREDCTLEPRARL